MLKIPYVPTPYPDEALGSLLTRLVLYNGTGLWRSLLEASGYGRRTISQFYAAPNQDARLDRLLHQIGYSYTDMLHQLTTLPFWLAFNNAVGSKDRVVINGAEGGGTRLFQFGRDYALAGARFCPACLLEDLKTHGEPYLHRGHQLPVSLVCAKHGEWLRVTCNACGVAVTPFNRTLLRPLSLRCACGQDLSEISSSPRSQRQELQRLSQFAESTLVCTNAPWTTHQLRRVLEARLNCPPRDLAFKAFALLECTYGSMERSPSGIALSLKRTDIGEVPLRLKIRSTLFRSPEFCALLSASGMTFEEFKAAAAGISGTSRNLRKTATAVRALTLDEARLEFDRLHLQSPSGVATRLSQSNPSLYWLLRLHDSSWLQDRNQRSFVSIPTIEDDRSNIYQALGDGSRPVGNTTKKGPWIRAKIRDGAWLQDFLKERRSNKVLNSARTDEFRQHERAVALSRALFSILRCEQRPTRIHAGLLSKVANVSMRQAQIAIANSPPLLHLLAGVNSGKDRRMAMWATRVLVSTGARPSAREVLVRAGLVTTRLNRQLAIAAIERLSAGTPDRAPQ